MYSQITEAEWAERVDAWLDNVVEWMDTEDDTRDTPRLHVEF